MFRNSVLFVFALALPAQDHAPGWLISGSATLASGIKIRYRTVAQPPLPATAKLDIGGVAVSPAIMHRSMSDPIHRQYFGYDLSAEASGPGEYRVTFAPLSRRPVPSFEAIVPKYPAPQTVREGETIALDLLVSADGTRRIVDYIQFETPREPTPVSSKTPLKDYVLDDGQPNIDFENATFWIDGRKQPGTLAFTRMRSGATLWIAVPGDGRFIFSLVPQAGFRKTGAIRDHVIAFQSNSHSYELRTQNLILGAKDAWSLHVFHDPGYLPKPAAAGTVQAGIDRLSNLLP